MMELVVYGRPEMVGTENVSGWRLLAIVHVTMMTMVCCHLSTGDALHRLVVGVFVGIIEDLQRGRLQGLCNLQGRLVCCLACHGLLLARTVAFLCPQRIFHGCHGGGHG